MADNVAITAGSGTTIAADDVGGVLFQRMKQTWGADGVATDTSASAPLPVQITPITSGGATKHSVISAATANATVVQGSASTLYSISVTNDSTSARYFKLYNKATAPTSSDTPVWRLRIPPGGGAIETFPLGLVFGTGLGYRVVTGATDSDNTSVGLSEIFINLSYK